MNLESVINTTYKELKKPKDRVSQVVNIWFNDLESLLSAVQVQEVSVMYWGTFRVDKNKFFRYTMKLFKFMKEYKAEIIVMGEILGSDSPLYLRKKARYEALKRDFRKLWLLRQKEGWIFQQYNNKRYDTLKEHIEKKRIKMNDSKALMRIKKQEELDKLKEHED